MRGTSVAEVAACGMRRYSSRDPEDHEESIKADLDPFVPEACQAERPSSRNEVEQEEKGETGLVA